MGARFADDPVDTSPKKKSGRSAERKKGSVGFAEEVTVDPGTLEDNFQEKGTRVNTDDMLVSASSSVDHSVGFELTLDDMTPATFTEDKQAAFAADLAKSLGLEPHQVEITGFTAGSLVIQTRIIGIKDAQAAKAMATNVEAKTSSGALLSPDFGPCTVAKVAAKAEPVPSETAPPKRRFVLGAGVWGGLVYERQTTIVPRTHEPPTQPPSSPARCSTHQKRHGRSSLRKMRWAPRTTLRVLRVGVRSQRRVPSSPNHHLRGGCRCKRSG